MHHFFRLLVPVLGVMALAACETQRLPETAEVASQGIPPAIKVNKKSK